MTSILIPLGQGSRHNNIELMYCLRSIEKHLSGVGQIFIVGECPEWLTSVVHVPCADNPNGWKRAENIYRKVMAALPQVSDNFLFMNDDHYLLQDYQADQFPYYHRGAIDLTIITGNLPQYRQMENTIKFSQHIPLDYDIHCPILYNKEDFYHSLPREKWPEYGYGIKSMYGITIAGKPNVLIDDLKFSEPFTKNIIYRILTDRQWFSIGDKCLRPGGGMLEVLEELYPKKSKYEL